MRTSTGYLGYKHGIFWVGMKPLSERDENCAWSPYYLLLNWLLVGMKPLSERDENWRYSGKKILELVYV